jgi:hypothetical protein
MADISAGDAYVDTALGTDDATHGTAAGANACKSLRYILTSRIVGLTGALAVHCVGAVETWTSQYTLTGKSTATYKLTIVGDRWTNTTDGKFDTTKFYLSQSNYDNHLFLPQELNIEFDGLQMEVKTTGNGNAIINFGVDVAAQVNTFKNCIFRNNTAGTGILGTRGAILAVAGSQINLINCIFYGFNSNAFGTTVSDASINVSNCIFHGNAVGIATPNRSPTVRNCLFDSNTIDFTATDEWNAASDYNSSTSDTALPGTTTHNYENCADFNFADLANHDFRLTATSGDPNARNSGVTIAACSPDPIGTIRPSETNYSRGAFEYVAAGGGATYPARGIARGIGRGVGQGIGR